MTISETYLLAHSARAKLTKEAARAEHHLRRLVGHANMLDAIMLELADAEREQERWFNDSVKASEEKHADLVETAAEASADDWAVEESDSESSEDDDSDGASERDELEFSVKAATPAPTRPAPVITVTSIEVDSDSDSDSDEYEDDEAESGDLALVRIPSHTAPELLHDWEDDSDDEAMPPSPPQQTVHDFSEEERKAISTTSYYHRPQAVLPSSNAAAIGRPRQSLFDEDYFLPASVAAY